MRKCSIASALLAVVWTCLPSPGGAARAWAAAATAVLGAVQPHPLSPVGGAALRRNWEELRKRGLRLLPVPKQIRFGQEPVVLAGPGARPVAIVLANDSERGRIAANEIVSRMSDFSVRAEIPVVAAPRPGAYNIVIENAWPNTFTRDRSRHPEARKTDQAYGLYPRADGIVLSGQGEMGMLYAAVTLRWLIEERGGKVLLYPAAVVDWPDYKHRQIGTLLAPYHLETVGQGPKAHLANMRKYMDWLFRMKATGVFRHTLGSQRYSSLPNRIPSNPQARACAKAVSDYARTRGIVGMQNGSVRLGAYPKDKGRPGFSEMMLDRGRNHYHSWARHDLHRNKARNMAAFCRECGFGMAFIHAVDAGGILDPELWSHRDALTRQKYGDDRVQADADMFNIYAEEFAKAGLEIVFVAYPYTADNLDEKFVMARLGLPDSASGRKQARELVAGMRAWMRGINAKLAPGVRMCIREAARANMFRFYDGYPGRPMWVYWELTHYRNSIFPILTTNVRCIGAGYSPDRPQEDILWANDIDYLWFSEPVRVAACEYAWNTRFPGSKDYDPAYMRGGEPQVDDQAALDILAERAAVGMWGAEAGALMQQVLASHLSWRVAVDPKQMTKRLPASVLPPLVRKNREAVRQACAAMDKLWEKIQRARASGRKLMDRFSYPYFVQFYAMASAARAYADLHLRELQAMEAIRSGDMKLATQEIAAGRKELAANKAAYEKTAAELANEPWVIRYEELSRGWQTGRLESKLLHPDFAALAKRLDELDRDKDRLYAEYNIPSWFKAWFGKRGLVAAQARGRIQLDGVLSEPAWRAAPAVDQFVGHRQYKVMSLPCDARLLYDDKHIYLGARLVQPLIGRIEEPKRGADEYVFTEQVEFLFTPGDPARENLYQFVVDTAGNLFTMRKVIAGKPRTEQGWPSGAKAAVRKTKDGWSFELAVPLDAIGKPPHGTWRAVLARDVVLSLEPRKVETFASAFFNGESYHTAARYSRLRFVSRPRLAADKGPGLHILNATMKTQTTARGAGSEVSFGLRVETRRPLRDMAIQAAVLGRGGRKLGNAEVARKDVVPLTYSTPRPVRIQLENEHAGVKLKVNLTYRTLTGERRSTATTVILGAAAAALSDDEVFVAGRRPGSKAVAAPVYFPVEAAGARLLSFERGTIEFWIRPRVDMALPPEQWGQRFLYLFHYGPQLAPNRTSMSRNSMAIIHEKKGWISFHFTSPDGDRRLVHSRLPNWKAGEWHHVACVWDLNADGKSRLALYLDGKKSSRQQWGRKGGVEDHSPLAMRDGAFMAQLGSVNSGRAAAQVDFDDLKIWQTPRYHGDFTPSRDAETRHEDGLLYFAFDGDLTGRFRIAGREGTVRGAVGAPGR